ncbi:hypothetical protein [Polaribacter sp. HaHaR_3_91]|uniref:hypothetical protein n=1 Tax=Polaribacter sp. HaHaR_3_91 TaxID=2745561 RepID=UPI001C4FB537|nr:hypothetical protein [Polaribacter sp. HaHaR_3_91]QXP63761.1 hypothetical protein H0I27_00740 [Polaribacter sp. HaHaR_3_91]
MIFTSLINIFSIETYNPNWFDYVSLFLTVGSIIGTYLIAEKVYNREKGDKRVEDISLQYSENELFKNNLESIKSPILKQIGAINEYIERQDSKMKFYPEIQVDFLQFISLKDIYKKYGFNNKEKIEEINKLMTNLYSLYDFRESLRSEVRTYLEKYNYHEQKFYNYRSLLYTRYFELCNMRNTSFNIENGIKKWTFDGNDHFMGEYSKLVLETYSNNEVMENNALISRRKLIKKFVFPLVEISAKYVPEDYNAIEINEVSNQVVHAFQDMEIITEKHFKVLKSYVKSLESVNGKINEFLE